MSSKQKKITFTSEENPAAAEAINRMFYNFDRGKHLCRIYKDLSSGKGRKTVHQADLLRAAVVLTHAALEDSLRTIAAHYLPLADKEKLNQISLTGLNNSGRPEKFHLGELVEFKGKTVDEVIEVSVEQHLSRLTFNNVNDIAAILKTFGLNPPDYDRFYPVLSELINRRHQIVHLGDRVEKTGRGKQYAASIRLSTVEKWMGFSLEFIGSVSFGTLGENPSMGIKIT